GQDSDAVSTLRGWHISQAAVTQGDSQPAASWQRDA
ncbi:hypothetical protein PSYMO_38016, partial [Pseudomonas amygdali pv. mori str. 301020]